MNKESRVIKSMLAFLTRPGLIDAARTLMTQESKLLRDEVESGTTRTIATAGKEIIDYKSINGAITRTSPLSSSLGGGVVVEEAVWAWS